LVVLKVRERLAVGKKLVKKMYVGRFNLKQLNEEEVKEQYQITIKNKFAALENLDYNWDIIKQGRSDKKTRKPQVFEPRFERGTSRVRSRSVNHSNTRSGEGH
jgi:hypothetical protein